MRRAAALGSSGVSVSPRLHFLAWHRPLPAAAAEWLAGTWSGGEALDLSDTLVVVPTRQAGRRLREALAAHAGARDQAVFPPRVVQPEQLLDLAAPAGVRPAPSRAAQWLGWIRVLQSGSLDAWREVFPVDPPQRNFAWALRLAQEFTRLQDTLAEGGLRFADVCSRAGGEFGEAARWEQLADLERRHEAWLERIGREGAGARHQRVARDPGPPPEGLRRVVVLATPDPRPTVRAVLQAWAARVVVETVVFADPAQPDAFDAWGQPRPEYWAEALLPLPEFTSHVHVCPDPTGQAELAAGGVARYRGRPGVVALGSADPELVPALAAALAVRGLTPYLPQGEPLERHPLPTLVTALLDAVRDDRWEPLVRVARHPAVLDWLGRMVERFSPAWWLRGLDELQAKHLPPTLAEARRHAGAWPEIVAGLDALDRLLEGLRLGAFPGDWQRTLATLFTGRVLETSRPDDEAFAEAAEAWRTACAAVAEVADAELAAADAGELALRLVGGARHFADKPPGAIEIDGWLELLFRGEPHLIVAGCNDGAVPEAVIGHAFLPESLRERLGLRTNAERLARDAWQLAALAASRGPGGRLDLLLGKHSAAGDPLRPSRLLLLCAEAELPGRVRHLFRELPPSADLVPWQRAWRLRPRRERPPETLRVTAFRDYLRCPFRFYLRHVLRLQPAAGDKRELDARDFGALVHQVLERLGRDPDWRDCRDDRELAFAFTRELDRLVAARFGPELSLPLVVQVESARQRLSHAARVQAAARADGWVIQHVEWPFPDGALSLSGLRLRGTIDRIERHEPTGRWRVLDYKTAEAAVAPLDAHVRALRPSDPAALPVAQMRVPGEGRPRIWTDLQLPLYRWAVGQVLGAHEVELGYFNLPKAVGETAITAWEGEDGLQESALACAEAVAAAVAAGRFWPPVETVRHDDYAELFHDGVAASVVWDEGEAEPDVARAAPGGEA